MALCSVEGKTQRVLPFFDVRRHYSFNILDLGAVQVEEMDNLRPSCHGGPREDIVVIALCPGGAENPKCVAVLDNRKKGKTREPCKNC